jgi:tetratricopeptide (TPR) repeat protein
LSAIYEEFGRSTNSFVGLYARLAEGRCYQALGDYAIALGCYEDILAQPNVLAPFRKLIATALQRKAEILTIQEKFDAAIELCNACLRDAKADEQKQPEWIAVQFRLAEALQKKAATVGENTLDGRKLAAEARSAYRLVANSPGEFQSAARMAISSVAKEDAKDANEEPKTFQEAYDLGKDALASYNAAKLAVPSAQRNNPEAVPELHSQMEQGKNDARRYFRAASTLVEDDTDPKLLNEIRYFLCWLYWESQDYFRAAVLGEFLARRYPDHAAAASSAKLAMASYERLYSQALAGGASADTDFESRRMAEMAEFIARRWPGTEDADAAQSVLVSYAIRNNRIEEAEQMLAEASPESRPRLEMQLGNAMWTRFLGLSQGMGQETAPDSNTLAQLKASAIKYLRSGFDASRKERVPSESAAAAGLYLVQALLSDEKYDEAIELLEDSKVGPLELIAQQHEAALRPQFVVETYKAALRAYVLSSPPQEKKALAIMKSLDQAIAAGGGDQSQLTQIYIGLGVVLEKQATQLREVGREQDAARINAAFSQFLNRIADQQANANWPTRTWLAQTYYNMGIAERAGPSTRPGSPHASATTKPLSKSSRDYVIKARDSYQKLLDDAAKDPKLPPNETSVLAVRMQLGECLRALGEYAQALDTFSAILKEKEASIVVQSAAAQTYQERGQAENTKWFENAIHGGHKLKSTGQNRIWGWLKISQVAQRAAPTNPQYRDTFYEARANIARCRYMSAMKQNGDERKQNLAKAKQGIQSLAQIYPDLGGQKWRGEFDTLMKQIQTAAGEKAVGLGAVKAPQEPAAKWRGG